MNQFQINAAARAYADSLPDPTQSGTEPRLYDLVSVMKSPFGGQRAHEPIACIAAATSEEALALYHANSQAFLHKDSGEAVPGLRIAAFESHKKRFCGPFDVVVSDTALNTVEDLAQALRAMQAANSAAKAMGAAGGVRLRCAQGWTVAMLPA